jgi:SnoaL-like domain
LSAAKKSLEERITAIEDTLEIYNIVAAHPISADTGGDYWLRHVFLEDGVFDRGDIGETGRNNIADLVIKPEHKVAIEGGLAHFTSLPYIDLRGDEAFVTVYLQIVHHDKEGQPRELSHHGTSTGYRVHRMQSSRWHLVKTKDGWRVKTRSLRRLDGTLPARELLDKGIEKFKTTAEPKSPDR